MKNRQIVLASRPSGPPTVDNFRLREVDLPDLADGEVRVHHRFLSLDPYMRSRMSEAKSYAAPQKLDEVMIGGTVGEIVESHHSGFAVGDHVVGVGGWQEYAQHVPGRGGPLMKVDTSKIPLSAYLGPVGMPGVTAWYGLEKIIAPKQGETIVVSAAAGAVGSVVGQLAKRRGCRAVGIAGGPDKCAHVVDVLGFDACVDYRPHADARSLAKALGEACPGGIDGDFENVGGLVLDAVMLRANPFSRIALCGMISSYSSAPVPMAIPQLLLVNRMKLEGFIVSEHMQHWPQALAELGALVGAGQLRYHETIAEGLDAAPEAFLGLLAGKNLGKQLVRIS